MLPSWRWAYCEYTVLPSVRSWRIRNEKKRTASVELDYKITVMPDVAESPLEKEFYLVVVRSPYPIDWKPGDPLPPVIG